MSKFKVGDYWVIEDFDGTPEEAVNLAVSELISDGWCTEKYIANGITHYRWDKIGIAQHRAVDNGDPVIALFYGNAYNFNDISRKLSWDVFTQQSQSEIIEELEAKIDNLEELISEQAERIRELESLQDIESEEEFKPVRKYTLEDWEAAMVSGWKFECRNGNIVTIEHLDSFSDRPVFCSRYYYHNINGMWDETDGEDADDIIRRVS